MRSVVPTVLGFALVAIAILFAGESARRQHPAALDLPPLPVGERVEVSVEPQPPTGNSLEVVSGTLTAADEVWVTLEDSLGKRIWIPRERVAIIRVEFN